MATVAIQCIQCAYYRAECKGKMTACDKFGDKKKESAK